MSSAAFTRFHALPSFAVSGEVLSRVVALVVLIVVAVSVVVPVPAAV